MSLLTAEGVEGLLAGAGLEIPPGAAGKLVRHAELMLEWNRAIRLTAITGPKEIAVKHILDSLLLLHFAPFPGRTLDFGSGAGYPGIALAIALPESRLVLLESSAKKCAFLSAACSALSLGNASVVRGRLDRRKPMPMGLFEQIVTRAAQPPGTAATLLAPYLAPGGRLLLMTGPGERAPAGRAVKKGSPEGAGGTVIERRRFLLPLGMGEREIAVWAPSRPEDPS